MIRINLLPIQGEIKRAKGRSQFLLFVLMIGIELMVLGLVFFKKSGELAELDGKVTESTRKLEEAKKDIRDADVLKKEKEVLEKQLDVLRQLERQRTGPVKLLDELQAMLSPPRNEEDRFAQRDKNWNTEWDTRRLWLASVKEGGKQGGGFELTGSAVSADDVAEFLQRLTTASHFQNVQLDFVEAKIQKAGGRQGREVRYVDFRVTGDISYSGDKVVKVDPNANKTAPQRPKR